MARRWARRIERTCCSIVTYLPLVFVYGLTSWAVWTLIHIGYSGLNSSWIGMLPSLSPPAEIRTREANLFATPGPKSSIIGFVIYVLANWSYTAAVMTPPGSTTNASGYGMLPTSQSNLPATSFTVKSNGELRFCKKCQARKPDRAHHCSTCQRCVLKMDHHCPWLATCVGLRNYKAFLLFLTYTTLLCFYAFAFSATWVWSEILDIEQTDMDNFMPVNFIMLSVMSGIIGIVLAIFTGWHISLAIRGQTTIECLESTRYLSPLRRPYNTAHNPANHMHPVAQQFVDFHTNALPGITRPEEGEERRRTHEMDRPNGHTAPVQLSYHEMEQQQSRRRYEEYLDEQDSQKLPSAFDLGWKRNLQHLFGTNRFLWAFPISNTVGDGWSWEASPKWLEVRERLRREREEQRQREINAGWGAPDPQTGPTIYQSYHAQPQQQYQHQSQQQYHHQQDYSANHAPQTKADRILGRGANGPNGSPSTVPLQRLSPRGRTLEQELDDFDNEDDYDGFVDENEPRDDDVSSSNRLQRGPGWSRGGASGMLRKGSSPSSQAQGGSYHDEGVD